VEKTIYRPHPVPNPLTSPHPGALPRNRVLWEGSVNALAALAIVLTLGLLAFAPLGAAGVRVGISAAFAGVIAGGLVYAALGSTAAPTAAPSSATALILAGLVARLAQDPLLDIGAGNGLLALLTVTASCVVLMGLLQVLLGVLGLGRLARFVPQPVLAGFMNGVAWLILLSQLAPLLGLPSAAHLISPLTLSQAQPLTLMLGLATAALVWMIAWHWHRLPAHLLALVAGSALQALLLGIWPDAPLGPYLMSVAPQKVLPDALMPLLTGESLALLQRHASTVALSAAVLALVGSLESLLAALVCDRLTQTRHDSRRELIALGAANIISGACAGLPMVLSRSRSNTLIASGVLGSPVVGVSTLIFGFIYVLCGPLLALLPRSVLAGIMLTIAVALADRWTHQLLRQLRAGERSSELRWSLAVVGFVCIATVLMGFVAGVAAGVLLSMLLFIRSMNRSLLRGCFTALERPSRRIYGPAQERLLQQARERVTLLELEGALFFGSAERLTLEAETLAANCRYLVLDMRRVSTIDESGAFVLQELSRALTQRGASLLLAGVAVDNAHGRSLRAFGCFREHPRHDWWADADHAIEAAEQQLLREAGLGAEQVTATLSETALLRGLRQAQLARVQAMLQEQKLAAGSVLFQEGDSGDGVYVLTQGSISIVGGSKAVRQRFVSYSPGAMLGEIAMLDGGNRTADAVADSDSVVYRLSREKFDSLAETDPVIGERLARNIARNLSERLRSATRSWHASAA
jgi:MFS superfamily sulfate permease-like transporter